MKKIAYTSFYALFAVFLVWITAAGFGHINGNLLSQLVVTMFVAVGVVAVGIAAYRCKPLHDRCYRVVVPVMFAGMYLLLTLFGVRTMTIPISDLEVLVEAAEYLLDHGNLIPYSSYFTVCRNTLGNALFLALIFWPIHAAGISIDSNQAECWGIALNCAMLVLTVYFLWCLLKRVVRHRNMELFFLLLSMAYIPFYLWAHRYYSDTLSLPFLPLGVLLYDNARKADGSKKLLWSLSCGICIWLGYFMRGSIAVVLAAIVIYSVFCDGLDFFRTAAVAVAAFALLTSLWDGYLHNNRWIDLTNEELYQYPTTMWLMYGAHDEGNYCDEDVQALQALPDYAARKEKAAQMLKEYYAQYSPGEYLQFLTRKYGITWGNGLFDAEKYLNSQRTGNFTHLFLLEGMPYTALFRYIANGLHFSILGLNILSVLFALRKREWSMTMLLQIVFLGNILFLSFWETKARYAFGVTPIMLFAAVVAVARLAEIIPAKRADMQSRT